MSEKMQMWMGAVPKNLRSRSIAGLVGLEPSPPDRVRLHTILQLLASLHTCPSPFQVPTEWLLPFAPDLSIKKPNMNLSPDSRSSFKRSTNPVNLCCCNTPAVVLSFLLYCCTLFESIAHVSVIHHCASPPLTSLPAKPSRRPLRPPVIITCKTFYVLYRAPSRNMTGSRSSAQGKLGCAMSTPSMEHGKISRKGEGELRTQKTDTVSDRMSRWGEM